MIIKYVLSIISIVGYVIPLFCITLTENVKKLYEEVGVQ